MSSKKGHIVIPICEKEGCGLELHQSAQRCDGCGKRHLYCIRYKIDHKNDSHYNDMTVSRYLDGSYVSCCKDASELYVGKIGSRMTTNKLCQQIIDDKRISRKVQ